MHILKRTGPPLFTRITIGGLSFFQVPPPALPLQPLAPRRTGRPLTIGTTLLAADNMDLIGLHFPLQRAGRSVLVNDHLKKPKLSLSLSHATTDAQFASHLQSRIASYEVQKGHYPLGGSQMAVLKGGSSSSMEDAYLVPGLAREAAVALQSSSRLAADALDGPAAAAGIDHPLCPAHRFTRATQASLSSSSWGLFGQPLGGCSGSSSPACFGGRRGRGGFLR